jgi:hypothetical protein
MPARRMAAANLKAKDGTRRAGWGGPTSVIAGLDPAIHPFFAKTAGQARG